MRIRALTAVCAAVGVMGVAPVAIAQAAGSTTTPALPLLSTTTTTTATTTTPAPTTATTTTPAPAPTTSTPTTTTPAPKPKPKPAPAVKPAVKARAALYLSGLFTVAKNKVTVTGRNVTVHGVVRPWVANQRVTVQLIQHGKVFAAKTLILKPSAKKIYGGFTITAHTGTSGPLTVRVKHTRSAQLLSFVTHTSYQVLSEDVAPGARGAFVELLQSRLQALHLYIPQTGVFDNGTELALDAYHRLLGWGEGHTEVGPATVSDLLDGKGAFHVRFPQQGLHAEGDLSDQVLAYMHGDKVFEILPISSGKPSTPTILGSYQVYRKQPYYTSDGMYFSNFFTGGYAIHGYNPAPDYPASHGCMRIPDADAIAAYSWINIGDWVDTYYT